MKLLVAARPNVPSPHDFSYVPDGEILYNITVVCDSDSCGCNRALSGTTTAKAITSAKVADADITEAELAKLATDVGEKSGWGEFVCTSFAAIRETIADLEPGTIVRPKFDFDTKDWEYIPENWEAHRVRPAGQADGTGGPNSLWQWRGLESPDTAESSRTRLHSSKSSS
jgi:hypothetical protein